MRLAAFWVTGLVCSSVLAADPVQRTLSFEERVKAQTAIERIYYAHQLGATKSFEAAVPKSVIEAKVRKYLEQSAALNLYWKTPVTDYSLQRELERMAQGTRMPERLQELYAALGNDAFLVKECLARATLVDRLTHNFYAFDPTMHIAARTQAGYLHQQLVSGELGASADHPSRTISVLVVGATDDQPALTAPPAQEPLTPDQFKKLRTELPANVGQISDVKETQDAFALSVVLSETATEVRVANYVVPKITWEAWWATAHTVVRGGSVAAVASGRLDFPVRRQDPPTNPNTSCSDDDWDNGSLEGLPTARVLHTAVWTGNSMLVWGGSVGAFTLDTGGRYDPATDSWTLISRVGAPPPRAGHTAVWTGDVMVVWGGTRDPQGREYVNSGGRYDPLTDTWSPTTKTGAPWSRYFHTAVWTGSRMIVWGGYGSIEGGNPGTTYSLNSGAQYDPESDHWTRTTTSGAPYPRGLHTAVWTGTSMIIWGGNGYQYSGGRYDPSSDSWTPTSQYATPTGRSRHSAVWTGSRMVIWGGDSYRIADDCDYEGGGGGICFEPVNTGGVYDPATDTWTPTATDGAPHARNQPNAVWTGSLMVVLGNSYDGTGGRYDPTTDTWTATSTAGAPAGREFASVAWTGSLMIVWGGYDHSLPVPPLTAYANTGARYDPISDSWTPTNATAAGPSSRTLHSATWTGSVMVVWGGSGGGALNTGGRYDPATDSWASTTLTGAPSPRFGHRAVWTGDLTVVWGNAADSSGGRYNPLTDSWSPTSTTGAPSPRAGASAVWTGDAMLVWGGSSYDGQYHYLDTGGRYDPTNDSWTPIAVAGAPSGRDHHTAVWTGSRMVVWGGSNFDGSTHYLNTGGRYDPQSDTWLPTSAADAPAPRSEHTAIWTGSRMVVWGGGFFTPGGRYDPEADVWTPVSLPLAPIASTGHSAVWTGSLMVIWGGSDPQITVDPATGGRYDPDGDHWLAINKAHAPLRLYRHTAVWTGDLMVVWGGGTGGRYSLGTRIGDDCDGDGFSEAAGDCDDHAAAVYPGAPQICDGVNDDCSDPAWPWFPYPYDQEADADNDGFLGCGDDCDDHQPTVYPGAPEYCDGLNNDCDASTWPTPAADEADADHDSTRICGGDCNDTDGSIGPGFWEYCDGLDNDCDSEVDEGAAVNCEDYDPCTDDVCAGAAGCTNPYNTSPCEDHSDCTSGDACSDGYCRGTPTNGNVCNDGNACTSDDTCVTGVCLGGTPVDCDDGDPCDGVEYCHSYYGCYSYEPLNCNDYQPCTDDSCDPATGCVHTVNDSNTCSDSNACTNGDRCVDGSCQSGTTVVCDDSNPCTTDTCTPFGGCVFSNNSNACTDGNACTIGDYCWFGHCLAGQPANCNDDNPCTEDSCNAAGNCVHVVVTGSCDDGNFCTLADSCVDGVCVGATHVDCSDNNPCTSDRCDPNQGCVSIGDENHCNDHNVCTSDICDPSSGGCTFVNNTAECDDGNACTSGDTCGGGSCRPGVPTVCKDGTACTTDSCDPVTGCVFTNNTNACDDGNACTTDDVCVPRSGESVFVEDFDGVAAPALPAGWTSAVAGMGLPWVTRSEESDTEPNTAFTRESNRPADALLESPAIAITSSGAKLTFRTRWDYEDPDTCWDGGVLEIKIGAGGFDDILSLGGSFLGGGYTGVVVVGSGNPLSNRPAWCHSSPGYPAFITTTVKLPAAAAGKSIRLRWRMGSDTSVAATGQDIDSIVVTDPANVCTGGPAPDCDDNDPCTLDSCNPATGCVHTTGAGACDDGNDCTDDLCSPGTGCSHINRSGSCNDGDPCTISDVCTAGACGGISNSCSDGDPCTADSCASGLGCRHQSFDGPCDDGNACTTSDVCSGGVCDGTPQSGGPCDDGNACTASGNCFQGGCYPGLPIACDDSNACTTDSCDPAIGCVFSNNTAVCDDGSVCTIGDRCGGGGCNAGQAITCNDGNLCTTDSCDAIAGCVFVDNTIPCDDLNVCTAGDACGGGLCRPGADIVCADDNVCTSDACDPVAGCFFINNSNACDDGDLCTADDRCGPPTGESFLDEQFDGVTTPALPAGWTASVAGAGHLWVTQPASPESAPNLVFGRESEHVSDAVLESPEFAITSAAATLTFRNRWRFEDAGGCYDASVLEIKIGAAAYADILSSGGTFVGGGYTGAVSSDYGNPLAGRAAWCSTSAGYPGFLTTSVNLPSTVAGQTIRLRWRLGSDSSVADTGQDIDSIEVRDRINGCNGGPPLDCDDNNPCTDDSCDPATGCVHTNNSAACNDGNACTLGDACTNGTCVGAIPIVCPASDQCHSAGICDPATGGCTNANAPDGTACDDHDLCTTGEMCLAGTCTPAHSGLNEPNPRTNGYYKSLCHGPHSGDALTDADAVCVSTVAHTFAGISTVADLCAELEPSQPNNDACDRTDDDLMVLALNICRARVCTAQSIDSLCGGNTTVGQSLAESDGILGSASRTAGTCARAKCLDEEINTGGALELNSLHVSVEDGAIRLDWSPPYLNDGTGHPNRYNVWRRPQGSILPFRKIGETTEPTFVDLIAGTGAFSYEVTAVMH